MRNRKVLLNTNTYDLLMGLQERLQMDSDERVCILYYISKALCLPVPNERLRNCVETSDHNVRCKDCIQEWLNDGT